MSVVDFRRLKASTHHVLAEPGLRVRGQLPDGSSWHVGLCEMVGVMAEIIGELSPTDLRIVEAVRRAGSVRAAAKALAPDSPSYRAYIQRRMKALRDRFDAKLR